MILLQRRNCLHLLLIFIVSLMLRAFVFNYYLSKNNRFWQVDSQTYHLVACELAGGKGYVNPDGSDHFYRLPGYSLLLATYYALSQGGASDDKKNVLWLQVIASAFIPILMFYLALIFFPGLYSVAFTAAWIACFHLGFVLYAGFFMTETFFIIFFLLFLCCFLPLLFKQEKSLLLSSAGAGVFLGIASLIRPVGHYLVFLSMLLLAAVSFPWQKKIQAMTTFFLGWICSVGWWLVRNYMLLGHLFFHTLPGGHFLYLSAARVAMHIHHITYQDARQLLHEQADALMAQEALRLGHELSPIEACLVNERLARDYFLKSPLVTIRLWATDVFRALFSLYSAELLYLENNRKEISYFDKGHGLKQMFLRYLFPTTDLYWLRLLIYLEIIFFFLMLLGYAGFCITAFLVYWRTGSQVLLMRAFVATVVILFFIIIALAGGYARMRLPAEPFLIIGASLFWIDLVGKSRRFVHLNNYKMQ